ncbi:MAG: HAD family hydrolase [Treponema sp.]|nr:HAD family hydrolase [Treponema sp.]
MNNFKEIKNIFLDAGGVILDETEFERNMARAITAAIQKHIPDYSASQYLADAEEAVYRFVPNIYDYILFKYIKNIDEFNVTKRNIKNEEAENLNSGLKLMDGIKDFLIKYSKQYKIGILGQYGQALKLFLQNENLLQYFKFTETQENFQITKPDPRYFEAVLNKCGCLPAQSVMIGDRIDKDIIPAKTIGMRTIRHRTGMHKNQEPRTPQEIPDFTCDRLGEISADDWSLF